MNALIENIPDAIQTTHFAALFLDTLLKSLVVLALAGGICGLWRRGTAATRHLIWFLAVVSLPCLPLLTFTLPPWPKPLWSVSTGFNSGNQISLALELAPGASTPRESVSPDATEASAAHHDSTGGSRAMATSFSANWMVLGLATWFAGAALVLLSTIIGHVRLHRFSRNAQPLNDADWARLLVEAGATLRLRRSVLLLQSADDLMPLAWGWLRPVVLLPAEAAQWPEARRQIVLLHELAHVKRWDCLTQSVVRMICAFYWFNPLVWLAARRLRIEQERACDDLVLNVGCKASDYASQLVEIASSFRRVPQVAAIAMARPSGLEKRVAAIVDASRVRRLRPATIWAVLILAGAIICCVGGWSADLSRIGTSKETNVTGVVVGTDGKPIAGVRCCVSGFPQPSGGRIIYSGERRYVFSDKEGHFTIPLPRSDPLVDLQFDEDGGSFVVTNGVATRVPPSTHAPAFLYKVRPADGPARVVMTEGKVLRGRIVERVKDELVPIPRVTVELQMPQEDFWYQHRQETDAKGEFHFRISEPPGKSPWMLYFAGKTLPVDYAQVTPDTVIVLEVSVKMTPSAEPNGGANAASPRRSP